MQLKHIKLAGFKSFVDPTRISFPTNMVAVVGPNGCGKSNVIDAVRWVLGELSAKNLRGDSMSDVIFNGSDLRKPSGQCSIELLFDNSMGKLGGEYAKYNEISIKRLMTRDGQSNYSINNLDINLICEQPKVSKFRDKIINSISKLSTLSKDQINLKGKTVEKLGLIGKEKAIACEVIVSITKYD